MHRYYRNRLIRSFLGSVNPNRKPDLFTDFDQTDNIDMSKLTHKSPLLIINTALNLLNDDNLALQERKASSFSISPLFCGNEKVDYRPSKAPKETSDESTNDKSKEGDESVSSNQSEETKNHNSQSGYDKNIGLGTAMAISGAAVSPNMGYNSSSVITFVMTLFNARLGWWLGNHRHDSWREIGPLMPFIITYVNSSV